jgi:hypothetical protein
MGQAEQRPPCAAIDRAGKRCQNEALPGRLFCAEHELDAEATQNGATSATPGREHEVFGDGRQEKG